MESDHISIQLIKICAVWIGVPRFIDYIRLLIHHGSYVVGIYFSLRLKDSLLILKYGFHFLAVISLFIILLFGSCFLIFRIYFILSSFIFFSLFLSLFFACFLGVEDIIEPLLRFLLFSAL